MLNMPKSAFEEAKRQQRSRQGLFEVLTEVIATPVVLLVPRPRGGKTQRVDDAVN